MKRGRGRLIALEGIDGCGKSTQASLLADALGAVCTFEPGATELGVALRRLLLDPGLPVVSDRAEALLMVADRAQHVDEVVEVSLAAGKWVVTDRFSGSTLAYQGHGRGLDMDSLQTLVAWAQGGVAADLSVLLDIPLEDAARRRSDNTGVALGTNGEIPDRLEGLDLSFHRRVRDGYLSLAAADPDHWSVVDGLGTSAEVAARVMAVVAERLGPPPTATSAPPPASPPLSPAPPLSRRHLGSEGGG